MIFFWRMLLLLLGTSRILLGDTTLEPNASKALPSEAGSIDCSLKNPNLYAQFLYLRAQNTGYIYGLINSVSGGPIDASLQRPDFRWEPGARVGISSGLPQEGWDIEAAWTTYYNRSSASITAAATTQNKGILSLFLGFGTYQSASGTWNVHFNMIDLDLGKLLQFSQNFSLRISGGLRGGWIRQQFVTKADGPTDPLGRALIFTAKDLFNGIGPLGGLNACYKLGKGFALTGNSSLSLLYGQIKTRQIGEQLIGGAYQTNVKYFDHVFNIEPALRLALGLSWTYCFLKNASFGLTAGWEANYWWDQYHVFAVAPIGDIPSFVTKSLSLEGGYFGVTANF